MPTREELRARFKLPPPSPSVQKIARLVSGRESAPMEEIVKILNCDATLTTRLICMAYPRVSAREDATVDSAIARLGVDCLIVLLIGDLLTRAVMETFSTMVAIGLEIGDPSKMPAIRNDFHAAFIDFNGKANGRVILEISPKLSQAITARFMGDEAQTAFAPDVLSDAVGELVNIVTGNMQSQLDDAGLSSKMKIPQAVNKETIQQNAVDGGRNEHFYFFAGPLELCAHLCINPFS